jgi:Rrf2 family protein
MKFTRQEEIALLFVSELAKHRESFISLSDVAQKHGVSPLFLKNIARMLRKEGIVTSKEGLNGGYILKKDPSEISALQVIEAVGGVSKDVGILKSNFTCPLHRSCMPQKIRHLISDAFARYLSDVTIDQFIKGGETI